MKQIEVKTDAALKKLAKELFKDLKEELNCFEDLTVTMGSCNDETKKIIVNENTESGIMTSAVITSCVKVLEWYKQRYWYSISYYIDIDNTLKTTRLVIYMQKWEETKKA